MSVHIFVVHPLVVGKHTQAGDQNSIFAQTFYRQDKVGAFVCCKPTAALLHVNDTLCAVNLAFIGHSRKRILRCSSRLFNLLQDMSYVCCVMTLHDNGTYTELFSLFHQSFI